jgi:hypothetical protein
MKPGDLVIILHEKDKLTSRYGSLGIVLSARNLGGTDDLGFQVNSSVRVLTCDGPVWRMRFELERVVW